MIELIRRAGTAFVLFGIGRLMSYLLQVVLARLSGPQVFGQYSYSIGVVSLIAALASMGYNSSVIRFVPEYQQNRRYEYMKGFLRIGALFTVIGGSLLAVVTAFLLTYLSVGLNLASAAAFAFLVPLGALIEYRSETARGLGDIPSSIVPNSVIKPLVAIGAISGFHLVGNNSSFSIGISLIIAAIAALLTSQATLRPKLEMLGPYKRKYALGPWTKVSLAMILMVAFQTLLSQADLIITGSKISATAAGFYSIGTKIAVLSTFPLIAVNQVFAPKIAELQASGNARKMQQELTRSSLLTFFPTLLIGLTLYFGAPIILRIYGTQYLEAKNLVHVLLIGQLFNAAAGPVGYVLNLTGNHRVSVRIFGVAALINLVGCYLAASILGTTTSVACVTVGTMILWNAWMHLSVVKRLNVWPSILGIFVSR